ncbi:MAG: hypothetical protein PHO11_03385, partial [Bacteroidales bacterium]|nr:hypothetical protein [Bacteroidales bacterium]
MQKVLITLVLAWAFILASAQDNNSYQLPPDEIIALVDAPQTPGVLLSPDNQIMLLMHRKGLPSIADLSQPEMRLAGVRFDP